MQLKLESENREAFELVTDALAHIDQYRASRDVSVLDSAKRKLRAAKSKDPDYFRAYYYEAVVDDLAGRPSEAIETFTRLLEERPPFVEEVRYNLGVAWYHKYHHEALDRALDLFATVIRHPDGKLLELAAHAGLAQAHAMHMIPKDPADPDLDQVRHHFALAIQEADFVLRELRGSLTPWRLLRKRPLPAATARELGWTAHNARGMALMYHSDYLPPESEAPDWRRQRIRMLRRAVRELDDADRLSPLNWANYCDMASTRMRLAYYESSPRLFSEALELLRIVIDRLRPGYGFALYETGRILRLGGDFDAATSHFERVLRIPANERDVGDKRLNIELDRARRLDTSFP